MTCSSSVAPPHPQPNQQRTDNHDNSGQEHKDGIGFSFLTMALVYSYLLRGVSTIFVAIPAESGALATAIEPLVFNHLVYVAGIFGAHFAVCACQLNSIQLLGRSVLYSCIFEEKSGDVDQETRYLQHHRQGSPAQQRRR